MGEKKERHTFGYWVTVHRVYCQQQMQFQSLIFINLWSTPPPTLAFLVFHPKICVNRYTHLDTGFKLMALNSNIDIWHAFYMLWATCIQTKIHDLCSHPCIIQPRVDSDYLHPVAGAVLVPISPRTWHQLLLANSSSNAHPWQGGRGKALSPAALVAAYLWSGLNSLESEKAFATTSRLLRSTNPRKLSLFRTPSHLQIVCRVGNAWPACAVFMIHSAVYTYHVTFKHDVILFNQKSTVGCLDTELIWQVCIRNYSQCIPVKTQGKTSLTYKLYQE